MAKSFDITPPELVASANKIEGRTGEFVKAYQTIYAATNDLRVSYKGQASDAFNTRIEGYKKDFEAVQKTLTNYIQFLREYADKMTRTENELNSKAGQLSTGGN
jgi:WXG100 family type VII secretion target